MITSADDAEVEMIMSEMTDEEARVLSEISDYLSNDDGDSCSHASEPPSEDLQPLWLVCKDYLSHLFQSNDLIRNFAIVVFATDFSTTGVFSMKSTCNNLVYATGLVTDRGFHLHFERADRDAMEKFLPRLLMDMMPVDGVYLDLDRILVRELEFRMGVTATIQMVCEQTGIQLE